MHSNYTLLSVSVSLIVAVGCGGRDSAASKSAAEFDRAQQQGGTAATTDAAHGGHRAGQESPAGGAETKNGEEKNGEEMAGMDHSNTPGMKPAKGAPPAGGSMAGMDHSNMPGMKPARGAAPAGGSMAGMDHSNMPGMTMAPPVPEPASVSAQPGQPAATLSVGDLDGPAPTSMRDAARSAAMAQEMAGGHGGMTHGTYSQTDAGRETIAPSGGTMAPGHGGHTPEASAPVADPHQMHSAPAQPRPSPSPAAATTPRPPQPNPPADPHSMHGQPASPRPRPSPGAKENKR